MDSRRWTPAGDRVLVAAFESRVRLADIARRCGRNRRSCQRRLHLLGYRYYTHVSPAEEATMIAMLRSGRTAHSVAVKLGRETHAVLAMGAKAGIPVLSASDRNRKGWEVKRSKDQFSPTEAARRVLEIVSAGPMRLSEVIAKYDRDVVSETVGQILRRLRKRGAVVCEGAVGRGKSRWFSVGWWCQENRALIHRQVKHLRCSFPWVEGDDMYQQFVIEIAKCARSFRPKGWKFSTYCIGPATLSVATWCRLEVARGIHAPEYMARTLGSPVVDHELKGNWMYHRVRECPDAPIVDESFWDKAASAPGLTDRERDVLVSHFRDGQTHQTIADRYGLSRGRIQQIIEKALEKVRASGVLGEYDPD